MRLATEKNRFLALRLDRATSVAGKWRELRKLGLGSSKSTSSLQYFTADTLNRHYASVCNQSPPLTQRDIDEICGTPASDAPIFNFAPVDVYTVSRVLACNTSNSAGIDGISSEMLKLASPCIISHLVKFINTSLHSSIFPTNWKRALIVPLSKVSTPNTPSETRPIALLSELSKITERIVYEQLLAHLESNSLLEPCQSGFRAYHSTQSVLLGILEDIRLEIDRKKLTALLAFD